MTHVKQIGMLEGTCVPFASIKWSEKEISKKTHEEEKNLEIQTEIV